MGRPRARRAPGRAPGPRPSRSCATIGRPTGSGRERPSSSTRSARSIAARGLTADEFARAETELGRQGLIEVVTLAGYYGMIAAILNAYDVDLPPGPAPVFGRRAGGDAAPERR